MYQHKFLNMLCNQFCEKLTKKEPRMKRVIDLKEELAIIRPNYKVIDTSNDLAMHLAQYIELFSCNRVRYFDRIL